MASVLCNFALTDPKIDLCRQPTLENSIGPETQVYIDARILAKIVQDLLDNAVTAVRDCPVRRIGIALREEISYVVDICDTGRGFPSGSKEGIFQDGASTRPDGSGGLGLHHARHQLTRFGGAILLADPVPAPWSTIVRVHLKPVEE